MSCSRSFTSFPIPNDLLSYSEEKHSSFLHKKFSCNLPHSDPFRSQLVTIIQKYWDVFDPDGVPRPIIDAKFDIDTGRAQPVCCPNPSDGLHESEIMREQLAVLEKRGWIMRYEEGAWGSSIVLAPKPHQEDVHCIDDFIWRLCVSYRSLNSVTLPFRIPIPVCNDALDRIGTIKHRHLSLYLLTLIPVIIRFHALVVLLINLPFSALTFKNGLGRLCPLVHEMGLLCTSLL